MNPTASEPFAVLFSAFFLIPSLVGRRLVLAANPSAEGCAPKGCGNGVDISYPFWLRGHQQPYCGYPPFALSCEGLNPVLKIMGQECYIRDIFYPNQSFLLDSYATVSDGACSIPSYNLSTAVTPYGISSANRKLLFLFNCSGPAPPHYVDAGCEVKGTRAYLDGEYTGQPSSSSTCETVVVPVAEQQVDGGDYATLLKSGVLLNWTAPDCSECSESGGRCGYDVATAGFMCICPDRTHYKRCRRDTPTEKKIMKGLIGGAMAAVVMVCLFLLVYLHYRKSSDSIIFWTKRTNREHSVEDLLQKYGSVSPKRYKYSEVKSMTKSFSQQLGKGGYGSVFKGSLPDGHPIAVKVLSESKGDGEEFVNEVASISRTSHINIVSLLGFCAEKSKRALIYEFMPNGSLEKFIYEENSKIETQLGWKSLYDIAVGVARGLEYLHKGCNTRIVHLDIKPQNILLDQEFRPKVSDFGLSKLCPSRNRSFISMVGARGTPGYIAPEVFSRMYGVVSSKSDVYSYGMMVLEMVGGRKNFDAAVQNSSQTYFPHWIYDHLDDYLDQYCIPEINGVTSDTKDIVKRMILVGLLCIQVNPANRPAMSQVVAMLEGSTGDLEKPTSPECFNL